MRRQRVLRLHPSADAVSARFQRCSSSARRSSMRSSGGPCCARRPGDRWAGALAWGWTPGAGQDLGRQVLGLERLAAAHGDRELERVLELADVARPVIGEQGPHGVGGELEGPPCPAAHVREQQARDGLDVLAPRPERRELDGKDAQPVVEVLAERSLRNGLAQVAVGGRDDPGASPAWLVVPDALVGVLLQDAQQLHLEVEREVAHLVQEQGAARGGLEPPRPVAGRAGERAAHVAEQLALQELAGEGGGVHRHERSAPARRLRVDDPGGHLLAGPALAGDEHGRLAVLEHLEEPEHPPHGLGPADEAEPGDGAGGGARFLVGRADDEQVRRLGVAHSVGIVLQRRRGHGEQPGLALGGPQQGAPPFALLTGEERLPERAGKAEELGAEDRSRSARRGCARRRRARAAHRAGPTRAVHGSRCRAPCRCAPASRRRR